MRVKSVFTFWLGSLDTHVLLGLESGGTHDVRFCKVEDQIERFTGQTRDTDNGWDLPLQSYPEADIGPFDLRLVRYTGVVREGECAIPMQYGGTPTAYPLWSRTVRAIDPGSPPMDAIVLLRDEEDQYHARVLRSSGVSGAPVWLRGLWRGKKECGHCIMAPSGLADLDDGMFQT
jgi:hypothetical protein